MTSPRSRHGSDNRRPPRRRSAVTPAIAVLAVIAILAVAVLLATQTGSAHSHRPGRAAEHASTVAANHDTSLRTHARGRRAQQPKAHRRSAGGSGTRRRRSRTRRRPPPGSLPQTSALPSSHTLAFRKEMSSLWSAIVTNAPARGRAAFFPKGAYLQLKEIEGAESDYVNRLLYDYALDIHAAHSLLGPGARNARLIGVEVPSGYAHWVPPGVCYNGIGYYETPNSRMIYREGGRVRSFGIASMISWRGVWYVVHLGAILRPAAEGMVDAPAAGRGYAEPSSTC